MARVPAAVEAVAYFAVTETLTNVAKHSHASRAAVRVHRVGDRLSIVVSDDGVGGAVASPPGGPTEVTVELPCG